MNLRKILSVDVIKIGLKSTIKKDVITELAEFLSQTRKIKDKAKALESVLEREERMSTGIQYSVAIPQDKTDAVDEMIACIAVEKREIEIEVLDNKSSTIFIMTISPKLYGFAILARMKYIQYNFAEPAYVIYSFNIIKGLHNV